MESAPSPDTLILIYVPCGSEDEAVQIARRLLGEKLIACGNIHPVRSLYLWEGEVADEVEYVLVCKTAPSRAPAAKKLIADLHSYSVPAILTMQPVQANYAYSSWVASQVARPPNTNSNSDRAAVGEA